jgi:xylan 1,4-beta-xylosidase
MDLMAAIVEHLQARYGAEEVRNNWYFEVWNESSWMYAPGMAGYNELYGYTVQGLHRADPGLRVGGPAESAGGSPWGISGLIDYTRSRGLGLDFVAYHMYANDGESSVANANTIADFHTEILDTVNSSNFSGEVFVTEWGPSYSTEVTRDNEVAASFIAKAIHLLGTNPRYPPPSGLGYWVIWDLYEEIDTGDVLAFREGNYGLLLKGDARYPESFDVAKPAFNAFRLLHLMGDTTLSTTGGTSSDGVNAAATIAVDNGSVQILVYNHVNGGTADSADASLVALNVTNLPFAPGSVRVRHCVLDQTHSNSYYAWVQMGSPAQPSQSEWAELRNAAELCCHETTVELESSSWTVTFPQDNYSVALIELSSTSL